ncbi:2-phospho-L-lactate guanylyltransferase [Micromonospora sp. DT81.3]|uniref:2-phospho-L-lactate guanylyltransferase n=1 Tax=Actinomycetes TaxID=1760 RepID=UPI003CFB25CE
MTGWTVLVPVKPSVLGKSRLAVDAVDRVAIARAVALDTIAAAAACEAVERVVVVTDDAGLVLQAADIPGLRFVEETPSAAEALTLPPTVLAGGLNGAIARGAAAVGEGMPRAALLGDLPALRSEDLAAALSAAAIVDRGVVADAEGTGSTLVTARAGIPWSSAFGEGSFAAHLALGFAALPVPEDSTLRRDVDTADQLAQATALGLGRRTAALLAASPPRVLPNLGA